MKKLAFACALLVVACSDGFLSQPNAGPFFLVGPVGDSILIGDSVTLTIDSDEEDPPTAGVTWESSDARIATVDGTGRVRTHHVGRVLITAEWEDRRVQKSLVVRPITLVLFSNPVSFASTLVFINSRGDIGGQFIGLTASERIFRYRSGGSFEWLQPPAGDPPGLTANCLDDSARVVGTTNVNAGLRPVQWIGSTPDAVGLTGILGSDVIVGRACNNLGEIGGHAETAGGTVGFIWRPVGGYEVLSPQGGNQVFVSHLNDRGDVLGMRNAVEGGPLSPFVRVAGGTAFTDIALPAGELRVITLVQDGAVLGTTEDENGVRAFRWTNAGGLVDLGAVLGAAQLRYSGIPNSLGEFVGSALLDEDQPELRHAFLWDAEFGLYDLTEFDLRTSVAFGINDDGVVVGAIDRDNSGEDAAAWDIVLWITRPPAVAALQQRLRASR